MARKMRFTGREDFAREIARLSLTLADVPNPDGWDLQQGDMYETDVLAARSSECRILLANPPYEPFEPKDKGRYEAAGHPVLHKKAVELLHRTLPFLRPDGVFAVVVPQAIVNGDEAKQLRQLLLNEFEIAEICQFPGKVFMFAEMETAVIIGRRRRLGFDSKQHFVRLRKVGEDGMIAFQSQYKASFETTTNQARFEANSDFALTVPALDEVWITLESFPRLNSMAMIGRGIEYKSVNSGRKGDVVVHVPTKGYVEGYEKMIPKEQPIYALPPVCFLAMESGLIENSRQGMSSGCARILVGRIRVSRGAWRIKALLDPAGKPVKNNFLVVQPKANNTTASFLWAVLNSPIANAYMARDTMKRDNPESDLGDIPIPHATQDQMSEIARLSDIYRAIALERGSVNRLSKKKRPSRKRQRGPSLFGEEDNAVSESASEGDVIESLLQMDAAVLKLYALPARLERKLLDSFQGEKRRGVGCDFDKYYPVDFMPTLPLSVYLSDEFRKSTARNLMDKAPKITDLELIEALEEVE